MRIFLILLMITSLNGCVGLAVGSYGTFESKSSHSTHTPERIIQLLGEPDKKYQDGRYEVFSYQNGQNWSGVGAFIVVVPVPLLAPTSRDTTRYYFLNGVNLGSVSTYGEVSRAYEYMCGSNECGAMAGIVNPERTRKDTFEACN